MKELADQHSICKAISATSPSTIASLSRQSHTITKSLKPKKIRIIHIYAPEVIKTDAANFRELVQRLTGMSSGKKKKVESSTNLSQNRRPELCADNKKIDSADGLMGMKEEVGRMWGSDRSGGVFGGLDDLDGFIRELGELPLNSARVNGAGRVNQGLTH